MPQIPLHQTLPDRTGAARHAITDIDQLEESIDALTLTIPASSGWSGPILHGATVAESVGQYDVLYLTAAGTWAKASAAAAATSSGVLGVALEAGASTVPVGIAIGIVTNDAWGLNAGAPVYLSATTAGAITEVAPTATDHVVRVVGYALSGVALFFHYSLPIVLL